MAQILLRVCRVCGPQPEANFGRLPSGSLRTICKPCVAAEARAWRQRNPERNRAAIRKWQQSHPEKVKAYGKVYRKKYSQRPHSKETMRFRKIRQKYGISKEQYEEMLRRQNGLCAICRLPSKRPLCVDHNHDTNAVRGLLCDPCNTGIGRLKDDVQVLRAAIAYLEAHRG